MQFRSARIELQNTNTQKQADANNSKSLKNSLSKLCVKSNVEQKRRLTQNLLIKAILFTQPKRKVVENNELVSLCLNAI